MTAQLKAYRVEGKDGFDPDADYYPISEHESLREAKAFAQQRLVQLAAEQPDAGGQAGIQDRVYIVHPDGQRERIMSEPPAEEPVILACIPDRDAKNLAWAKEIGLGDNPPWLEPYAGSSPDECEACGGVVWVGPTQAAKLAELNAAGMSSLVLCHLCAIVLHAAGRTEIRSLNPEARTSFVPGTTLPDDEFEDEWRRSEE